MIGKTNVGNGSSLSFKGAMIRITAPTGSTITLIKNNLIIKTLYPKDQHIFEDGTKAYWYYSVSPSNYGSWTITATRGIDTTSNTVVISDNKQYEVKFRYPFYLYNRGDQRTSITGGWSSSHAGGSDVKMNTDNIEIYQAKDNGRGASVYSTNQIDFTNYSVMHFVFTNTVANTYTKGGVSNVTNYADISFLASTEFPVSSSETEMVVNISAITGLYYPRIYGGYGILRIYKVWLE